MQSKFTPSKTLDKNRSVYNTYKHLPEKREVVLRHLSGLYQAYLAGNPITIDDAINTLDKSPDNLLVCMMVELKKMIDEKGCFKFAEREENCLIGFFKAFTMTLTLMKSKSLGQTIDFSITESLVKKVHQITTDKDLVTMDSIEETECGEYRKVQNKIEITKKNVSIDGITQLITLITEGPLTSMIIGPKDDYTEWEEMVEWEDNYKNLAKTLEDINSIDLTSSDKIFKSIEKYWPQLDAKDEYKVVAFIKDSLLLSDLIEMVDKEMESESESEKDFSSSSSEDELEESSNSQQETKQGSSSIKPILKKLKKVKKSNDLSDILQALKEVNDHPICKDFLKIIIGSNLAEINTQSKAKQYKENHLICHICHDKENHLICHDNLDTIKVHYKVKKTEELAVKLKERLKITQTELFIKFPDPEDVVSLMKARFASFNEKINKMLDASFDEKLHFLCEHLQLCLLIHPFIDGNNRVFLNIIDNCIGVLLGVPLKIYYNPLAPYCHSIDELVETTKLACANYLALQDYLTSGSDLLLNLSQMANPTLTGDQQNQLQEFVKPFHDGIKKLKVNLLIEKIELYFGNYLTQKTTTALFHKVDGADKEYLSKVVKHIKQNCTNSSEVIEYLQMEAKQCGGTEQKQLSALFEIVSDDISSTETNALNPPTL